MTAVPLFDALIREATRATAPGESPEQLNQLAERLISAALCDLDRINEYERQFGSPDIYSDGAIDVLTSVYGMYEEWAIEAEQVLTRVRQRAAAGQKVPSAEQLEDKYGRVRARLGVTPEKIAAAIEQARSGNLVSGETVRNELRARLHG